MNRRFELPSYSLFIHPYDLYELDNPIRLFDDPVPGMIKIDKIRFDIYAQFRGHHTRELPRKSYFIELDRPRRYLGSREFHLNAEYFDPSFIRNKLSLDLFQSFGTLSPGSQHIQLYVNDQYEGVYLQLESVDDLFIKKRGLPDGAIYYAINNDANFSLNSGITNSAKLSLLDGYQCKIGTNSDENYLKDFIKKINETPQDVFEFEICKFISVDKYLRWLAVAVCTQNLDGFLQNYALYRNSETGIFEIIPWDYDATFGRDWNGDSLGYDTLSIKGNNRLTERLLEIPAFRRQYRLLMEELLDIFFTPSHLEPIIHNLFAAIRPYLKVEQSSELEQFNTEKEFMIKFIKDRNQFLRQQLSILK